MVEKVLTTRSFIGGRLREAGETVDFDEANPALAIPAPSSSLAQLSAEEIEAYLRRLKGADKAPADSTNLADPTAENTGRTNVPLADITVRSGGSRPQGAPPGSVEVNGQFVAPAPAGASAPTEAYTGEHGASTGSAPAAPNPPDLDGDGQPGGSLTKAEIVQALRDRGDAVDTSATKAELQTQLSAPPKA